MKIRIARQNDFTTIAALHAASWRNAYRGVLSDEYLDGAIASERMALWNCRFKNPKANQHIVVAEQEANIVGFACAYGNEDEQWGTMLDNLHVLPAQKGHGIGRTLISHVASWCSVTYQRKGLFLWAFEQNVLARSFYERLGGKVVGNTIWIAPDGTAVTELRYSWKNADMLVHY